MTKYKVTPVRNGVVAPFIMVEVPRGKQEVSDAIKEAESISRLSDFQSWEFKCERSYY